MYSTAQTVYLYITHTSVYALTVQYTASPIRPKIGKTHGLWCSVTEVFTLILCIGMMGFSSRN